MVELERRIAHLQPKPKLADEAGAVAVAYAAIALFVQWLISASGPPLWIGSLLGLAAAWAAARYDTKRKWKPYFTAFNAEYRHMKAETDAERS